MQVLLVGPFLSNASHGAEVGIHDALFELGHQVQVWDYRAKSYFVDGRRVATDFNGSGKHHVKFGAILCPGPGLPPEVLASTFFRTLKGPKILWNSEPIRLGNYRGRVESQRGIYDHTFTFDESEIPLYREIGVEARWLPQAFNPKWYLPLKLLPQRDLVFVGSIGGKWSHRLLLLQRLSKNFDVGISTCFDAVRVNMAYNQSKLILNLGLYCPESGPPEDLRAFGLQQRIFEAIGAGKVCLTNSIPSGTNDLFTHGHEILFYTSQDLEEVVQYGLREHERMEANVLAVREAHGYKSRMAEMLRMLEIDHA